MSDSPSVMSHVEQAVSAKFTDILAIYVAMVGGSVTTFLAKLGDQSVVAGVGVVVAVAGLVLKAWHNYAVRRQAARLEYAKMTPEQREVFDQT